MNAHTWKRILSQRLARVSAPDMMPFGTAEILSDLSFRVMARAWRTMFPAFSGRVSSSSPCRRWAIKSGRLSRPMASLASVLE